MRFTALTLDEQYVRNEIAAYTESIAADDTRLTMQALAECALAIGAALLDAAGCGHDDLTDAIFAGLEPVLLRHGFTKNEIWSSEDDDTEEDPNAV